VFFCGKKFQTTKIFYSSIWIYFYLIAAEVSLADGISPEENYITVPLKISTISICGEYLSAEKYKATEKPDQGQFVKNFYENVKIKNKGRVEILQASFHSHKTISKAT
jgi:hypothetical protein